MRPVATSIPVSRAVPALGARYPVKILSVVDLPAPFGPRNAATCPWGTLKVTSRMAAKSP